MLQNMTEGAPLKLIIPFMVPLLIGNVFQQLYNIADIIIVGRTIGVNALAAVGAVSPLFMLTMVLTIGLSNGFTVVTGQRYGAQDMQGMRRSIATCVVLSLFFVLLIIGIMHLVIDPMLVMMNIPPELMEDAYAYVMIIVDGLLAMMAYNLLSGIMRSLGDSKTPLYFLIISSILNIILALVFIIIFGWGVPGSAFALVIAQAFSAVLCVIYIYKLFIAATFNWIGRSCGRICVWACRWRCSSPFWDLVLLSCSQFATSLAVIRLPALLRQCA